jgi:hypothetical protein
VAPAVTGVAWTAIEGTGIPEPDVWGAYLRLIPAGHPTRGDQRAARTERVGVDVAPGIGHLGREGGRVRVALA